MPPKKRKSAIVRATELASASTFNEQGTSATEGREIPVSKPTGGKRKKADTEPTGPPQSGVPGYRTSCDFRDTCDLCQDPMELSWRSSNWTVRGLAWHLRTPSQLITEYFGEY